MRTPGLVLSLAVVACGESRTEVIMPPGQDAGRDVVVADALGDGPLRDTSAPDTDNPNMDGSPSVPVRVGIVPVPRSDADAEPDETDDTRALLDVLSAGSRAISLVRRWDELFIDSRLPNADVWARFSSVAPVLRDQDRSVLLALAVLDRTEDARPSDIDGPWDSGATLTAARELVDRAYGTFGSELAYLSIGSEVDHWLATASVGERGAFASFVRQTVDYARAHPNRPDGTQIGVTVTAQSLIAADDPDVRALLDLADVAVATYYPMDGEFQARAPTTAADDLDALRSAFEADAGARPLVLQEVGYPSSTMAGGTDENQRSFFDAFFGALLGRRSSFPFVSVYALNDRATDVCEAEAAAFGVPGSSAAIAARCSLGVRARDGTEKPAWFSVLDGIATFASP